MLQKAGLPSGVVLATMAADCKNAHAHTCTNEHPPRAISSSTLRLRCIDGPCDCFCGTRAVQQPGIGRLAAPATVCMLAQRRLSVSRRQQFVAQAAAVLAGQAHHGSQLITAASPVQGLEGRRHAPVRPRRLDHLDVMSRPRSHLQNAATSNTC